MQTGADGVRAWARPGLGAGAEPFAVDGLVTLPLRFLLLALATVATLLPGPAVAGAEPAARTACATTARSGFRPVGARVDVLGRDVRVVPVRRTANGAIGTPPVTKAGKSLVGWDRATRPGAGVGSVILDAHTWPDGSALGNALLGRLRPGHTFSLRAADGRTVCYRVSARRSYPAARLPRAKAFRDWGPEQAVIVVCSGRRLGAGRWTRRTVWYAEPLVVVAR
ncbi:class F sortase [Nocardioides ginsengisoli]|uniref:Class F sortase n=1 Tax=Nocardioides ginsengisoli TaxID=363868 RepID=A0ABW3W500_9ACTN